MKAEERAWFAPLWRRVLVTAVCALWAGFEWVVSHDQLWGLVATGFLAYAIWSFFITYKPPQAAGKEGGNGKS